MSPCSRPILGMHVIAHQVTWRHYHVPVFCSEILKNLSTGTHTTLHHRFGVFPIHAIYRVDSTGQFVKDRPLNISFFESFRVWHVMKHHH